MKSLLKSIFILMIRFYQGAISPYLMPSCRYIPSCSEYGIEALKKYGPFKGAYLTIRRFLSCGPWSKGGHDPLL